MVASCGTELTNRIVRKEWQRTGDPLEVSHLTALLGHSVYPTEPVKKNEIA